MLRQELCGQHQLAYKKTVNIKNDGHHFMAEVNNCFTKKNILNKA